MVHAVWDGNFSPALGARNQVGIGLSYRPASLCSLATQFQTRFLESIPRPIAGLKFSTLFPIGQLVVVSEGREFLAGEEMANILVIKKIKRMKNSNNGFFGSLNNFSSIFV